MSFRLWVVLFGICFSAIAQAASYLNEHGEETKGKAAGEVLTEALSKTDALSEKIVEHMQVIRSLKSHPKFKDKKKESQGVDKQQVTRTSNKRYAKISPVTRYYNNPLHKWQSADLASLHTQTDAHLQYFLGDSYISGGMDEDVEASVTRFEKNLNWLNDNLLGTDDLNKKVPEYDSDDTLHQKLSEDDKEIFKKIYRQERQHRDRYVFYHSTKNSIGFLVEFVSALRSVIMIEGDNIALRGKETLFKKLSTLEAFLREHMNRLKENAHKIGDLDGASDYRAQAIATNVFLFGNVEVTGESTSHYFLSNYSDGEVDINNIITRALAEIGVDSVPFLEEIERLQDSFKLRDRGACMLQFLVHPKYVDRVAYLARQGGVPITVDGGHNLPIGKFLAQVRKDPVSAWVGLEKKLDRRLDPQNILVLERTKISGLQARFFLDPKVIYDPEKVMKIPYWRSPLSKEKNREYKNKLNALARKIGKAAVRNILENKKITSESLASSEMPIIKLAHLVKSGGKEASFKFTKENFPLVFDMSTDDAKATGVFEKLMETLKSDDALRRTVFEHMAEIFSRSWRAEPSYDGWVMNVNPAMTHYTSWIITFYQLWSEEFSAAVEAAISKAYPWRPWDSGEEAFYYYFLGAGDLDALTRFLKKKKYTNATLGIMSKVPPSFFKELGVLDKVITRLLDYIKQPWEEKIKVIGKGGKTHAPLMEDLELQNRKTCAEWLVEFYDRGIIDGFYKAGEQKKNQLFFAAALLRRIDLLGSLKGVTVSDGDRDSIVEFLIREEASDVIKLLLDKKFWRPSVPVPHTQSGALLRKVYYYAAYKSDTLLKTLDSLYLGRGSELLSQETALDHQNTAKFFPDQVDYDLWKYYSIGAKIEARRWDLVEEYLHSDDFEHEKTDPSIAMDIFRALLSLVYDDLGARGWKGGSEAWKWINTFIEKGLVLPASAAKAIILEYALLYDEELLKTFKVHYEGQEVEPDQSIANIEEDVSKGVLIYVS